MYDIVLVVVVMVVVVVVVVTTSGVYGAEKTHPTKST